jgi:hypothetical protein
LQRYNTNLCAALRMAERMAELADTGEAHSEDDGCMVLYGVIRDCAYKIRGRARQECEAHRVMGKWESGGKPPEQEEGRPR